MKFATEKNYQELFKLSLIIKAVDGILEAVLGLTLAFVNYATLTQISLSLLHEEVAEHPRDLFWGYLIHEWHVLSLTTRSFWSILFLAHGIIKVVLSVLLLKNKWWAYPLSAGVFSLFIIYEVYAFVLEPSLFLGIFAAFDTLIVILVLHEYQQRKKLL